MTGNLPILSEQFSPDFLLQIAQGFHEIGIKSAKELIHKPNRRLRHLVTGAVNFSFAAELLLKGINIVSGGQKIHGHDLDVLYQGLEESPRKQIETLFNQKLNTVNENDKLGVFQISVSKNTSFPQDFPNTVNLEHLLKSHNKTFINWRYLHEVDKDGYDRTINFDSMNILVGTLIEVMDSYHWDGRFHNINS